MLIENRIFFLFKFAMGKMKRAIIPPALKLLIYRIRITTLNNNTI